MVHKGNVVQGYKVINTSNNDEVVAEIYETHVTTTNGYKVIPIQEITKK